MTICNSLLTHLLQIIGEAAGTRQRSRRAANILRSIGRRSWVCEIESFTTTGEIDLDVVWETATLDVPRLLIGPRSLHALRSAIIRGA